MVGSRSCRPPTNDQHFPSFYNGEHRSAGHSFALRPKAERARLNCRGGARGYDFHACRCRPLGNTHILPIHRNLPIQGHRLTRQTMSEERHTLSEPRLIPERNWSLYVEESHASQGGLVKRKSNFAGPVWIVGVYRHGVADAVETVIVTDETLPPRKNKKGKVIWCLPDMESAKGGRLVSCNEVGTGILEYILFGTSGSHLFPFFNLLNCCHLSHATASAYPIDSASSF